jgi:hypothetical protein
MLRCRVLIMQISDCPREGCFTLRTMAYKRCNQDKPGIQKKEYIMDSYD